MSRIVLGLSCVVFVVLGCKKEETVAPPSNLPPAVKKEVEKAIKENVPEAVRDAPAAQGAAAAQKLNCEKAVPVALREKYFPGTTMTQEPQCPGCPEACKFGKVKDEPGAPMILFDCRDRERPNWLEQVTKVTEQVGQPVEGLGRFARTQMKMQLLWAPEKYNCVVSITWMGGGEKLLPLGKDLEAALTPEGLGI